MPQGWQGALGSWLPLAVKSPVLPTEPMSCLDHHLGPSAMTFATSSYAHATLASKGAEMAPSHLSMALDELL